MSMKKTALTITGFYAGLGLMLGCAENPTDVDTQQGETHKLLVLESDFQSGLLEWVDATENSIGTGHISLHSDAVIRKHGASIYILERFGSDNVVKINTADISESGILYQTNLGDNWNPQDIEFVSETKAYIANQNEPKITIFDPSAGTVTDNIDISMYTFNPDSNASPYANQMALWHDNLYVMLQRRDGWNPGAPTLIITINTATDEIVASDSIPCHYKNGYDMICVDDALYITNPGSAFSIGDGGIEKIDLSTKEVGTVIDENDLGGNPNQIVHKSGTRFYVQNYIGWKDVSVVELDAASGTIVSTLPEVKDAYGGLCYDEVEDMLYVGERDSLNVGIRVFHDNEHIAGPVHSAITLPPTGMVLVR